ncbi:NAD(P)H-quinone oxidoreductase [uncultured Paraglaciecola sp.]|uniref:NAD(P)H-quinone oxidoreductase n=1 Tax=uncultured Paraglaciecola sp. TaxID=1765024 RepID=UPI0030DC7112|tara:strand:- start:216743 stop:217726 length:984 start_codon:yes stop_codon:yes gene_type:complete
MQYIKHQNGCAPEALDINQTTIPELAANQVLVKVACFGLNRADTLQRQGKYPAPPGESDILGLEVSGTIEQIHPQQTTHDVFKFGDKVFGLVAGGGYAEYVAVNTQHLMPAPAKMDMAQVAGIAECFLTAYQALFIENNLQPNQHVLIHAGASGVGLAAIQLAKRHGCSVAVTASSQRKLDLCKQVGADLVINYQQQDFAVEIAKHWKGCDLIIDFVAGDYLNRNLKLLNIDGNVLYLAMLAGRYADKLDMALMLGKRATVKASTLRNRSDQYKTHLISAFSQACLADFDNGKLFPNIDSKFAAKDIGKAHQRLESNDTMGKLIGCW